MFSKKKDTEIQRLYDETRSLMRRMGDLEMENVNLMIQVNDLQIYKNEQDQILKLFNELKEKGLSKLLYEKNGLKIHLEAK